MSIGVSARDSSSTTATYFLVLIDSSERSTSGTPGGNVGPSPYDEDGEYYESPSSSPDVIPTGNIVAIEAEDLEEGTLDTIVADVESIDKAEDIKFLTDNDIGTTYEPTQSMKQDASAQNMQYITRFQSITVQPESYYLFEMDFPEEYIGMPVGSVKLQVSETAKLQDGSVRQSQVLSLIADRIFAGTELRTMGGKYAETIAGKMLILLFSNTGGSFAMFALKTLASILGGSGGCNVGGFAGSGLAGLLMAGAVITLRKRFRK